MTQDRRAIEAKSQQIAESTRDQIAQGHLLPGQALNQVSMAADFGTSRVPVREALQLLLSEGLVHYQPNIGYTVARLNANDLKSIYIMRKLLEGHLLRTIEPFGEKELAQLSEVNHQMSLVADKSIARFQQLNFTFHFTIFQRSPHTLILGELERLWRMSEPYRLVWASDGSHRQTVLRDHEDFIHALAQNDVEMLVQVADQHRKGVPTNLAPILPGPLTESITGRK